MPAAAVSDMPVTHVGKGANAHLDTRPDPSVRTLPIRVAPVDGESLESWLAAIAVRLNVTWAELLDAVLPSCTQRDRGSRHRRWSALIHRGMAAHRGAVEPVLELIEIAQGQVQ